MIIYAEQNETLFLDVYHDLFKSSPRSQIR